MKKIKLIDTLSVTSSRQLSDFTDESVREIICSGVLEFIEGKYRGAFMDEIYRVLTLDGSAKISVPYWSSSISVQDFRYAWPPFTEQSFLYFNRSWRDANKIKTKLKCNFEFTYGYSLHPDTDARNVETQRFQIAHYTNSAQVLHVNLTKRRY